MSSLNAELLKKVMVYRYVLKTLGFWLIIVLLFYRRYVGPSCLDNA